MDEAFAYAQERKTMGERCSSVLNWVLQLPLLLFLTMLVELKPCHSVTSSV
jgi:hypothetical protein